MADLGPVPSAPIPEFAPVGSSIAATPFWDLGPSGVYVQFAPELVTPWERVSIGGTELPGRASVLSAGRVRKIQRAGGPGDEAEQIIDVGALAADIQIIVQIWTLQHLRVWEAFSVQMQKMIEIARASKTAAPAMDVDHPGLNLVGISSLYIYQVSVLQPSNVRGVMESTILATEYRPRLRAATQAVAPTRASQSNLKLAPEIEAAVSPPTPAVTDGAP
jgi:hypothetical protein